MTLVCLLRHRAVAYLRLVRSFLSYVHSESCKRTALGENWTVGFEVSLVGAGIFLVMYRLISTWIGGWFLETKAIFRTHLFAVSVVVLGLDAMGRSS